jgi:L-asparaginase
MKEHKPSILIVYTGGTIGMIRDHETNSLQPFDFSGIENKVPEIKKFGYLIDSISLKPLIDSSNINISSWVKIANIIQENYNDYDGFVVLHGTDTMSYSASALSFMVENLEKPIIFTGSQLPIGTLRTDGKENLITAIEIAAAKLNGSAIVPEVCIYFENKLFRGNRTTKHSTRNFSAFISDNYPPLALAGIEIDYNLSVIHYPTSTGKFKTHNKLNENVIILKLFPGLSKEALSSILSIPNLKGVILETYGSGNAPTIKWFLTLLKQAIDNEIIILNITQCDSGGINMGKYETSRELLKMGVVNGADLTTEAASTKLMFILEQGLSYHEIRDQLQHSLRGEMSET